jgi:AcrR family transcriptional regulator
MARSEPTVNDNNNESTEAPQRWAQTVKARSTRAHGRRTLVKLLDAAVAEFDAHGWHGARMARLAKRAGTAHGTVYAYFTDKDDLLCALWQDVGAELRAALMAMPPLEPGPESFSGLRDWVAEVCGYFKRYASVFHAVGEVLLDEEDSRAGRAGLRDQRRVLSVFADRIRATGATGLDPEMAALSIYALLEGANESVHRGELLVSDDELITGIAEFVHRSVFGSPAPQRRRSLRA